jgi:colanic acid/amylovoran biosynthesis glycosyltransferase
MPETRARRMGYLVSRYPAVSHTFILREVEALRRQGFVIETASINPPDQQPREMPAREREEAARTYYVKAHGLAGALAAHAVALWQRPLAWLAGLVYALRLGGTDLRRIALGVGYFTEALMVGRWMRASGLPHLHVHFATAAANVGLCVKKIFGTSLSLMIHGPDEFDDVRGQSLAEKIAKADFLFCIGSFARSQAMRLSDPAHWAKIEIARLGVDPAHYAPAPARRSEGPFHVLCVGRLVAAKGQHVLVDAAQRLIAGGHDLRVTLVGSGPEESGLRAAVDAAGLQAHIRLTGALNQDEVRRLYGEADAFVLPSFAEGIPVVLMEAMASGVPCVTTRITGIPELIRSDDEGLLVAPSDACALAAAIARLIEEPELRARIAGGARRRVDADFHLGRNTVHLGQLFARRLEALQ